MQVRFWGVRGSVAAPGIQTAHFGGNTSCYEVKSRSGTRIILDAGTGIRVLGSSLLYDMPIKMHLLISHTHWDHIQGFVFFAPAFYPGNIINIYGPKQPRKGIADVFKMQMTYEVFPVRINELESSLSFHDLTEEEFEIDDLKIKTLTTNHPVRTLAYRIQENDKILVYSGDIEPYTYAYHEHSNNSKTKRILESKLLQKYSPILKELTTKYMKFCEGADLLIHDAQYLQTEYLLNRRGWGHSPIEHVVEFGIDVGVKKLVLSHHDPGRTDTELFKLEQDLRQKLLSKQETMELYFGHEGQFFEI